jgi:hypothetical protein
LILNDLLTDINTDRYSIHIHTKERKKKKGEKSYIKRYYSVQKLKEKFTKTSHCQKNSDSKC